VGLRFHDEGDCDSDVSCGRIRIACRRESARHGGGTEQSAQKPPTAGDKVKAEPGLYVYPPKMSVYEEARKVWRRGLLDNQKERKEVVA